MKIAVIDDYQDAFRHLACYPRLAGHEVVVFHDPPRDENEAAARLADADILLLTQQRTVIPASLLKRLPKLRMISQTGRNTSHLDVATAKAQGITVSAGGSGGPNPTAELTWALILAACRHIPQEVAGLKAGHWQSTVGTGLARRTLGIYALGSIGSIVAGVGKAFGMTVMCWGREGSLERARAAGYAVAESRQAFFANCDIICLHLPLNDATRGIVTAADLAAMKPDSLLVNTSRGPIIAPGVLVTALQAGHPGHAALDVYDQEPVYGATDPLIGLENTTCTPHLGYVEARTLEALYGAAIDQILAFAEGKPINVMT